MNPIFRSNQSIGYGQVDYMQVEPAFGNEADLLKMCTQLHENKLKVMMDAVIHFSPWDSLYLDNSRRYPLDGETESADSAYAGLYMPGKDGEKYLGVRLERPGHQQQLRDSQKAVLYAAGLLPAVLSGTLWH